MYTFRNTEEAGGNGSFRQNCVQKQSLQQEGHFLKVEGALIGISVLGNMKGEGRKQRREATASTTSTGSQAPCDHVSQGFPRSLCPGHPNAATAGGSHTSIPICTGLQASSDRVFNSMLKSSHKTGKKPIQYSQTCSSHPASPLSQRTELSCPQAATPGTPPGPHLPFSWPISNSGNVSLPDPPHVSLPLSATTSIHSIHDLLSVGEHQLLLTPSASCSSPRLFPSLSGWFAASAPWKSWL